MVLGFVYFREGLESSQQLYISLSTEDQVPQLGLLEPSPSLLCTRESSLSVVKKQPSQDVLHGDEAEEELGLACLVSSYTLPHQNSQPGERGRQTARSKVLSRRARDT